MHEIKLLLSIIFLLLNVSLNASEHKSDCKQLAPVSSIASVVAIHASQQREVQQSQELQQWVSKLRDEIITYEQTLESAKTIFNCHTADSTDGQMKKIQLFLNDHPEVLQAYGCYSPLDSCYRSLPVLKLLLEKGASANAAGSDCEWSILRRYIKAEQSVQNFELLLEYKADPNKCDIWFASMLHAVVASMQFRDPKDFPQLKQKCAALIKYGADCTIRDVDQRTVVDVIDAIVAGQIRYSNKAYKTDELHRDLLYLKAVIVKKSDNKL